VFCDVLKTSIKRGEELLIYCGWGFDDFGWWCLNGSSSWCVLIFHHFSSLYLLFSCFLHFPSFRWIFLLFPTLFVKESHVEKSGSVVYSWDQLIALGKPLLLPWVRTEIPEELQRRHRGCGAGAKRRAEKGKYKPSVPAIIMGNVGSLGNKMDELGALIRNQREYWECSILCFTESWLHSHILDYSAAVSGFRTVQVHRDILWSSKKKEGGIALFVNEKCCNPRHINVNVSVAVELWEYAHVTCWGSYLPSLLLLFTFVQQLMQT